MYTYVYIHNCYVVQNYCWEAVYVKSRLNSPSYDESKPGPPNKTQPDRLAETAKIGTNISIQCKIVGLQMYVKIVKSVKTRERANIGPWHCKPIKIIQVRSVPRPVTDSCRPFSSFWLNFLVQKSTKSYFRNKQIIL